MPATSAPFLPAIGCQFYSSEITKAKALNFLARLREVVDICGPVKVEVLFSLLAL